MNTINWNEAVILKRNNVLKAVIFQKGKKIVFEKLHFYVDNAINGKFNTFYKINQSQLVKLDAVNKNGNSSSDLGDFDTVEDNRELIDLHGKTQGLKQEDIIDMRKSGKNSDEIIQSLIDKSSSFSLKTGYSQEKYINKKNKKHSNVIQILKPSARLLCEMYQDREPAKISMMNSVSVSQLLTITNVRYDSNVILVDSSAGMILAMVLQRLGGAGHIINLHPGETPTNFHCAKYLNLPEHHWSTVFSLPMNRIASVLATESYIGQDSDENFKPPLKRKFEENSDQVETTKKNLKSDGITDEEKSKIRQERRERRTQQQNVAWDLLKTKKMNSLIFCSRYHPTNIVMPLLKCLSESSPFAVYCEYREPLMELFSQIVTSGMAINLNVSETFSRNYQVLLERTHPLVMMKTGGGFILSGIIIAHI